MAENGRQAETPLLDEWLAEAGEDGVASAVTAARAAIENGSTPGFTDREALLEYLGRRRDE